MLNMTEFKKIESIINKTTSKTVNIFKKEVLNILKEQFTRKNDLADALKNTKDVSQCINPTRKDPSKTTSTEFELKNKVKIRQEGESQLADSNINKGTM